MAIYLIKEIIFIEKKIIFIIKTHLLWHLRKIRVKLMQVSNDKHSFIKGLSFDLGKISNKEKAYF